MTPEIMAWGNAAIIRYNLAQGRTLEMGSMNVNGSLRQYFNGDYFGIDQAPGPGVDRVMRAAEIPNAWAAKYDTVVCTEMLEHDLTFWLSLMRARFVLQTGGHLLLSTCGFGFGRHDFPSDYYRFTLDALEGLLRRSEFEVLEATELPGPTVTAVGRAK